ncbi:MAG TPA: LysR substrate-binding domain-containing protein [Polyangiaceae bacterium]|nr:LysR substrate-binding domain-containing protein [Polyangiaceae bacterium]
MDLRLLRSFVAVAEELHFGRAAKRLHLSQPPLSMHVRKLEEDLGARLFDRTRRHVALTEAGEALLGRARHLLTEAASAAEHVRRVGRGESGTLAVAYTPTATYEVLPPLVGAFRGTHPDVQLELVEMRSPDQPEAIRDGRVEIGFACGPVDADGLLVETLVVEDLVAVLPARHRLSRHRAVRVLDLAEEPFVLVRPDVEPAWAEASDRALRRAGATPRVAQHTDTKLALLGLVAAGMGVSVVSASMRRIGREGVVFAPLIGLSVHLPLVLVSGPSPSPRATAFVRAARRLRPRHRK